MLYLSILKFDCFEQTLSTARVVSTNSHHQHSLPQKCCSISFRFLNFYLEVVSLLIAISVVALAIYLLNYLASFSSLLGHALCLAWSISSRFPDLRRFFVSFPLSPSFYAFPLLLPEREMRTLARISLEVCLQIFNSSIA